MALFRLQVGDVGLDNFLLTWLTLKTAMSSARDFSSLSISITPAFCLLVSKVFRLRSTTTSAIRLLGFRLEAIALNGGQLTDPLSSLGWIVNVTGPATRRATPNRVEVRDGAVELLLPAAPVAFAVPRNSRWSTRGAQRALQGHAEVHLSKFA